MRIAFLCGSLEMGRDGVGDYTRRLGGELQAQGHQVWAVALNDPHVAEEVSFQENAGITTLRLPAAWSSARRFQRAEEWLANVQPEWISLQFVPFAFHKKGLAPGLGGDLEKLTRGRKCEVMFHELWVGMKSGSSRGMILWGFLQRSLILSLIRRLRPLVIHSQTPLYLAQLARQGISAKVLPLFGNIPAIQNENSRELAEKNISFIHFGTIYPEAPVAAFAKEVAAYATSHQIEVSLQLVGRAGGEESRWISEWEKAGLKVEKLGEQTPERISHYLTSATIGIATTAYALIEKSGSVAAMQEHGLPVICVSHEWQARGFPSGNSPGEIFPYREGKLADFLKKPPLPESATDVAEIARRFSADLLTSTDISR